VAGLRDEKKRKRRDRVFRAALKLFEKKGFAATTMKEIAERAELGVGTLYNYFPSKNALLLGIMEKKMEEISQDAWRSIVAIFRQEKDPQRIMEKILALVLHGFLLFSKRTWIEIFHAFFSTERDLEQGLRLDLEGIRMLERIIRIMQNRGLVQSRFSASAVALNLYSVLVVQLMIHLFVPGSSEEELHRAVSAQLELIFQAIAGD
jgi:AcrR family transcriptional regulator